MLIHCDTCNSSVELIEVGAYVNHMEWDWMENIKYSFCKCNQCNSPILIQQKIEPSQDGDHDWGLPEKIFPSSLFHVNPIIPTELRNSLSECIKCYKANAYTATAIMCRRTIEGFATLKGIQERTLDKSITRLNELGIINDQLHEWANLLRLAGNEAAHNINSSFEAEDAKDILDFTIAVLDFSYSFKEKFENFKQRIQKTHES